MTSEGGKNLVKGICHKTYKKIKFNLQSSPVMNHTQLYD